MSQWWVWANVKVADNIFKLLGGDTLATEGIYVCPKSSVDQHIHIAVMECNGHFWGECPMFRHTAVFNFRASLGTWWFHKWNCWTEVVLKLSFPWIPLATWQWKIRMSWGWCSHEFPMKMGIPWPSVTRKLSTQAGTAFRVNINMSSLRCPQPSAIAPSLWYTLLLSEA